MWITSDGITDKQFVNTFVQDAINKDFIDASIGYLTFATYGNDYYQMQVHHAKRCITTSKGLYKYLITNGFNPITTRTYYSKIICNRKDVENLIILYKLRGILDN